MKIAILGLGEAGSHFANDLVKMGVAVSGWDPNITHALEAAVYVAHSNADAVKNADVIWSVNYTSESKGIAEEVLPELKSGAIYCEMNTSSPKTKKEIEQILEPADIHFADVAELLKDQLSSLQLNLSVLNENTGDAAERKLLRSIVYKGVAAVICEAMEAGAQQGLEDYIRAQIHSIIGPDNGLIDRFIEGSRTHAQRRMHEMEAVVDMLSSEELSSHMSQGAVYNLKKYIVQE